MTDNLAYTEIRKPDVHTGARVFGVVDLCVDSGVDDDESAAARTRLKRGAQHGEQRAFGAGNALRVVVELGCGMGEQLVIKGVRRFLRQRDGMGGKHARLLFDACHCAGMMGIECVTVNVYASDTEESLPIDIPDPQNLYAKSAVLIDGDSGRVLYAKDADNAMPMASTTKIMTCILALEHGKPEDIVTVSEYAASMPEVSLGMRTGEQFYLEDLLYSLMLESHNDTAVAIAEHITGSV